MTPFLIPVTLTVNQLTDGGFEASPDHWVVSGLAMRSAGRHWQAGTGYLLMGGSNRGTGTAYQQLTLAPGSSLNLSFWLNVTSDETTTTDQQNKLVVEVRDTHHRLLKTLATFSHLNKSDPGSYMLAGNYSLAGFAGQRVRIQFRAITDRSSITSFRIDDVMVK